MSKQLCGTGIGRCGIFGGLAAAMALVVALVAGLAGYSEATTCSIPNSFTTGQVPTAAMFNDNWNAACTIINGQIDNTNIATSAGIVGSKLANDTITAAQLAPGSVTTSEILDSTILSGDIAADTITAADIAPDAITASEIATGAVTTTEILDGTIQSVDIMAGLIPPNVSRVPFVHQLANQANTSVSANGLGTFVISGLTNDVPKDVIHCAGFLYVVIDDTVATDHVYKINATTMGQVGGVINLASGDNPIDIECALDGSVYVLNDGTFTVKKIDTAGVVTTLKDLNVFDNVDNVSKMSVTADGTVVLVIAQDENSTTDDRIYKILTVDGTTTFTEIDVGVVTTDLADMVLLKRNNEQVAILVKTDATPHHELFSCVWTDSPPTCTEVKTGIAAIGSSNRVSLVSDGQSLYLSLGSPAACTSCDTYRFNLGSFAQHTTATISWTDGTTEPETVPPENDFFNGTKVLLQQPDGIINMIDPFRFDADNDAFQEDLDFTGGQASPAPCGIGGDGSYTFVCTRHTGNSGFTVTKILLN